MSHFLRICNQSLQKVLIRAQKMLLKYSIWVSKNAKVLKKCTKKKLLAKPWRKYALFSLLLMFIKLVLLITFLVHFLTTFSSDRNQHSIFSDLKKNCFMSSFWKPWSQTRKKRLKKSKNVFSKCILDFNIAPVKGSLVFISEQSQICCTLLYSVQWQKTGNLEGIYEFKYSMGNEILVMTLLQCTSLIWLTSSPFTPFGVTWKILLSMNQWPNKAASFTWENSRS